MIRRLLPVPKKSFLLLGPRGTGKSTWLESNIKYDLFIDLLNSQQFLKLSQNPSSIIELTSHLKPGSWVVIDEIQKIPLLLSEVHSLYERKRLNFALTGSSARKLKREGVDLLAGRALQKFMYPMVFKEYLKNYSISYAIEWGSLPLIIDNPEVKVDTLATYVNTYLKEELVSEAIIRKLDPFVRFLQIAGIYNGQILNIENLSREASVKKTTAEHYFQILEDTLIAYRVPAFQSGAKVKETKHPRFYFFDAGVARAASGLLSESLDNQWRGFSFETLILNELKAFNHYNSKYCQIFHYNISGSYNIDFIIETKKKTLSHPGEVICLEVKLSKKWNNEWNKPLLDFKTVTKTKIKQLIGVYLGKDRLSVNGVSVYPIETFLNELYDGKIF